MNEKNYSESIAEVIRNCLKEEGWKFYFNEEQGTFEFGLWIHSPIRKISYTIKVWDDAIDVRVVAPIAADTEDKEKIASMAEFVCRANYGLKNGNFEFDVRDGEIGYKVYTICEGITPSAEMVNEVIHCPAAMFQRYGKGITDVLFGNVSAKDAVAKCEARTAAGVRNALLRMMEENDHQDESTTAHIGHLLSLLDAQDADDEDPDSEPENAGNVKMHLFDTETEGGES